jgi:hypothetical protein
MLLHFLADAASDPTTIVNWASRVGSLGLALVFGWLFLTDRIVSGKTHQRVLAERDRVYALLLEHAGVTRRVVEVSTERLALEEQLLQLRKDDR